MTAADVIKMLAEMDQQCVSGRPSVVGRAAEIVQELCRHAEGSIRDSQFLGDFESIDLAAVRSKRVSRELWHPTLDLVDENDKIRDDLGHARTCIEILNVSPKTLVHRPGGRWDVFEDTIEAGKFLDRIRKANETVDAWHVSSWDVHISRDGPSTYAADGERLDWLESCDFDDFKEVAWQWKRAKKGERIRDVIDRCRSRPADPE